MTQTTQLTELSREEVDEIMDALIKDRADIHIYLTNGRTYDIVWNALSQQPEIIEPGTTAIRYNTRVSVIMWLLRQNQIKEWSIVRPEKGRRA